MSEEEKDLVDFLYGMISQDIHKIYDYNSNDRKICDYINLIENQQKEIECLKAQIIEELQDKIDKINSEIQTNNLKHKIKEEN